MLKALSRPGDWLETRTIRAYNRTGATRLQGDVGMIDLLQTQAETTSATPGDVDGAFHNVGPAATAGLGAFPFVVAAEDIEDNAIGTWYTCGVIDVRCADDDAATTDIDAGDSITVLNAAHDCEACTTGNRRMGLALADGAASGSDGDSSLVSCIWWGGIPGLGAPTHA